MRLTFCGAAGTVTGSKYLLERGNRRFLVDCGLFQGVKELRLKNWAEPPFDPSHLDGVLLTHAHIDHSGYLPVLVKRGFRGTIYATRATRDLCNLLLPDAGRLQEEEAGHANRHGYSKHRPALALFTEEDAKAALRLFRAVDLKKPMAIKGLGSVEFIPAGHILGAASIVVDDDGVRTLFSGDLGQSNDELMKPPECVDHADYVLIESTYGNRVHTPVPAAQHLADVVNRTSERGGVVVVPSFCVGRAQEIMLHLSRLKRIGQIPDVPVFLNSPMAADTTDIYRQHHSQHRLSEEECHAMCTVAEVVSSVEESKALNRRTGPMVIIAGSGMATGGRVTHHIQQFAPDARNTILFVGYQAAGTRGAAMVGGAQSVKMHGVQVPIRAEIARIEGLSAHADSNELVEWLKGLKRPPRKVLVTHGEPEAAAALAARIRETLGFHVEVPKEADQVELV